MKSAWKSFGMTVLLLALLIGANAAYGEYARTGMVVPDTAPAAGAIKDWGKPDTEGMTYYGLEPFETTLPVLYINTGGQRITKENKIWATLSVLEAASGGATRSILETPERQEAITLKLRGASSYSQFDKQQYRVKIYKKEGSSQSKEVALLGMAENSEWVLNGPFLDKTLLRNRLVYAIGREMFEWAPDARYVELFVNGEYRGVYLVVEPVSNGASRLRLSRFGLLSGETAYIVKRDRLGTEENPLDVYGKTHGTTKNDLFVEYPSAANLTDAQQRWITADISAFERALYGENFADPALGYAHYIDVDCFVDYFILNEVVMNHDAGDLSTYPYKELGGKLKIAIWDYNNCYDNYQGFAQDFSRFWLVTNAWFSRLVQDRAFVDKVVERYTVWREDVLSTESMLARLDGYQLELGDAVHRNFAVWGYTFDLNLLVGGERDIGSYPEAVRQLRTAIEKRFAFLDAHITDLYAYCIN